MKREHTGDFWTKEIAFYLDGVSFVHRYNPADQVHAPKGRIWRKDDEGLAFGCTAKGLHCGTRGRVAPIGKESYTVSSTIILTGPILRI